MWIVRGVHRRLGREHFRDQNAYLQSCFPNQPQLEWARRRGNDSALDWRELMEVQEERLQDEEEARQAFGWLERRVEDRSDRYWWRSDPESLCFELLSTAEEQLTHGAPASFQWWDVEVLAESEHFVALSKPAGMFVVTDERGLWEESATNFIHVAHRRVDVATRHEPRQRGICHRLDSHTSGVQVFGKSWCRPYSSLLVLCLERGTPSSTLCKRTAPGLHF